MTTVKEKKNYQHLIKDLTCHFSAIQLCMMSGKISLNTLLCCKNMERLIFHECCDVISSNIQRKCTESNLNLFRVF